jgi:hypothetical protein
MTLEEAIIVLEAAVKADGGCLHCFSEVFRHLVAKLPGTDWKPALFEAELDIMDEDMKVRCWNENQAK